MRQFYNKVEHSLVHANWVALLPSDNMFLQSSTCVTKWDHYYTNVKKWVSKVETVKVNV